MVCLVEKTLTKSRKRLPACAPGNSLMQRTALVLFMLLALALPAAAVDDMQEVADIWKDFVSSLRRGDYPGAHALFSPESRAAMPFAEFVAEYGPLSAAREMILARPESQSSSVDNDWAEITIGGVNPGSGRRFRIGVALVRNLGSWGLVAARNEGAERAEAGARALLRAAWAARERAGPREILAAAAVAQEQNALLRQYRLEVDAAGFRAFPKEKGLRTFFVDSMGMVRSVERTEPQSAPGGRPAAMTAVPPRTAMPPPLEAPSPVRRLDENGMPEMAEPPPVRFSADLMDELPEPPLPFADRMPEPALPEIIR